MRYKILTLLSLLGLFFVPAVVNAGVVDLDANTKSVQEVSASKIEGDDALTKVQNGGLSVLRTFKVIIWGIALVFMVWAGARMVMSMGSDDKALTASKKELYFALTAFLFVNIPGQMYDLFWKRNVTAINVTEKIDAAGYKASVTTGSNMFINFDFWNATVTNGLIQFIKVWLLAIAILMFVMAGFQYITSKGDEKTQKNVRAKFVWGLGALIFIGLIEAWIRVVYGGSIPEGQSLFAKVANLALFFAGPIAIFFLILGGYYMITSGGDEEKAKKGKNIVINTAIATIILVACYTFLKDLADLIV